MQEKGVNSLRAGTYELYDNGVLIGCYSPAEISKRIGIPKERVTSYAASGARYQSRYTMEAAGAVDGQIGILAKEWDETTERLRNSPYDLSRIMITPLR